MLTCCLCKYFFWVSWREFPSEIPSNSPKKVFTFMQFFLSQLTVQFYLLRKNLGLTQRKVFSFMQLINRDLGHFWPLPGPRGLHSETHPGPTTWVANSKKTSAMLRWWRCHVILAHPCPGHEFRPRSISNSEVVAGCSTFSCSLEMASS